MGLMQTGIITWEKTGALTLRKIFGSSWGRAFGRNIGASSRTMSNIFTMTL